MRRLSYHCATTTALLLAHMLCLITVHGRVFFPVLQVSIVAMISFLVAGQDLSEIPADLSFSCVGKPYGYYADVATNCKVFHICLGDGDVKWSFLCPNQTSFNQVFLLIRASKKFVFDKVA